MFFQSALGLTLSPCSNISVTPCLSTKLDTNFLVWLSSSTGIPFQRTSSRLSSPLVPSITAQPHSVFPAHQGCAHITPSTSKCPPNPLQIFQDEGYIPTLIIPSPCPHFPRLAQKILSCHNTPSRCCPLQTLFHPVLGAIFIYLFQQPFMCMARTHEGIIIDKMKSWPQLGIQTASYHLTCSP